MTVFLVVVGLVLAGVVVASVVLHVQSDSGTWLAVAGVGLLLTLGAFVGALVSLGHNEEESCHKRGGQIVGTGEYSTTYVRSGNVMIPITSEITECRVPK